MKKINRSHYHALWKMRHFTVKEFFESVSKQPDLKFLLTVAGAWWITRMVFIITIAANVIYYVFRIFHLVLR